MLRPKRMSRVSVTGSKRVMDDAVEAVHDLNLLHVTDYDDSWTGFEPGDPVEGAEAAAEKLVTVRALQSTLGVTEEDAGRRRIIEDEELDEELEDVRQRVNELDDRRNDLEDELREIDDNVEAARPFAELGIDLDLLSGYDNLTAAVGEADADELRLALEDAEEVDEFELFESGGYVAVFAYPEVDLQDVLVGTAFTRYEVPDLGDSEGATSPGEYIDDLQRRRQQVESKLETVEHELTDLRHEVAGFLLAAEEKLAIEVQKREAPLAFATTENAFVAEGWIPTERYGELAGALESAVGEHVEVEELERASYDEHGHAHEREDVGGEGHGGAGTPGEPVAADGGTAMSGGEPPVVQDNPKGVRPFEALVEVINRPRYSEIDPTFILFLTFPLFFGFMIGDVGYGLLYMGIGFLLMSRFDSDVVRSLGGVGFAAGVFTTIFGLLYGEFFGLHVVGDVLWGGHPPMHKGLQPAEVSFAQAWLILSLLAGLVHLTVGYVIDFYENLSHGIVDAVTESLSWVLLMVGVWVWIFSHHASGPKPAFLFKVFAEPGTTLSFLPAEAAEVGEEQVAYALGFTGFSETVGIAALGVAALGLILLVVGEGMIGLLESLNVLVNVLSYTRLAAVTLAKAGMAFVVNLLFFGAYRHHGEFHFLMDHEPQWVIDEYGREALMFSGLIHSGVAGFLVGILVLLIGHALVLVLGITSAGLQGVRLEYVEFFGKFYEGGGKKYAPFGYDRTYTAED